MTNRPVLAALPPLPPAARPSTIIAPVAVALSAIRTALDNAAPREFTGNRENPLTQLLGKAEIGLTLARGPVTIAGQTDILAATVPIDGTIHITGQIGEQAGKVIGGLSGAIGNLLGGSIGKKVEQFTTKAFDQKTDIHGTIVINARPTLTSAWRLDPNLAVQLNLGDTNLKVAGITINLAKEIRPLLDPVVDREVNELQARIRADPVIENAARREWSKMCRSIPLGGGNTGLPALWLELKPVKAFAAQPRIDARAMTLTVGIQSQARVGPAETKPSCPFPATLELVPLLERGRLAIGIPMDVPFTEVNKLLETQIKGQKFIADPNAPVEVEIRKASVGASGERLLISLLVKARERKSWFGFGAEATVHVWGKPVIDSKQQILRLTDLSLAVESEAAFGLLGAAAKAAVPYLTESLAENAVIDLKPFLADARAKIGAALADFRQVTPGVIIETAITDLRLIDLAFDSKTLRIVTESAGTVKVAVTQLPK